MQTEAKIWSPIWSPGVIWSPIWSPERQVIDLVVVDAVTFTNLNGRDLKDSFMILSDFSFIFLLRNFIYDMSPSAEKEIKITPYGGGGIEGKHSPKIYPQGYSLSFLGHGLLKLHFRIHD